MKWDKTWNSWNLSFGHFLFHEKTHFLVLAGSAFQQIWLEREPITSFSAYLPYRRWKTPNSCSDKSLTFTSPYIDVRSENVCHQNATVQLCDLTWFHIIQQCSPAKIGPFLSLLGLSSRPPVSDVLTIKYIISFSFTGVGVALQHAALDGGDYSAPRVATGTLPSRGRHQHHYRNRSAANSNPAQLSNSGSAQVL